MTKEFKHKEIIEVDTFYNDHPTVQNFNQAKKQRDTDVIKN